MQKITDVTLRKKNLINIIANFGEGLHSVQFISARGRQEIDPKSVELNELARAGQKLRWILHFSKWKGENAGTQGRGWALLCSTFLLIKIQSI